MIIHGAYCSLLCEFSNDNSFGTKGDFEFSSKKALRLINDFNICAKFRSLLALLKHSQAFCGQQFAKFEVAAMILLHCHLTKEACLFP